MTKESDATAPAGPAAGAVTDLVNAYFRQFYPAGAADLRNFEYTSLLGGMWGYRGSEPCDNIFPRMLLADGFTMSVQGHRGAYSSPRDDFAKRYTAVEVGYPSEREELLMPYVEDESRPTDTLYGYVPIEVIEAVIAKHGGLIGPAPLEDEAPQAASETSVTPDSSGAA